MRPWRDGRDIISPNDSDETILSEKWRLLPEFLKIRGLVKEHIDSYNYFIDHDIKKIVTTDSTWHSDVDKRFFVKFKDVRIGSPQIVQDNTVKVVTPHTCRLRNLTYSAPIKVDIVYTRHDIDSRLHPVEEKDVLIGYLPVMLRSRICVLNGASEEHLARFQECPHDPGGYFIIKGTEKVILIQEQLSKNRIIIEEDAKGSVFASITSSTNERKSRTAIVIKDGIVHLKHNCFTQDIPIAIVFKAMGIVSDQEFVSLIGITEATRKALFSGIKDAHDKDIRTQEEALDWIGSQVRGSILGFAGTTRPSQEVKTEFFLANPVSNAPLDPAAQIGKDASNLQSPVNIQKYFYRTRADEARDLLASVVLSHVPAENFDFRAKAVYIAFVVRRCLEAQMNKKLVDDRDYYGNKRLELAGQLLSLLFEDLFKRFNSELKMEVDKILSKQNKAQAFDLRKHIRTHLITSGFTGALSSGNWSIKRFKMERSGITQQVTRLSYMSAIGHMTRISSQFEKTRKVSGPRSLQPSQWGMLCPSDTPEGESCGLVKNLSLLTHVTTDQDPAGIINLCMNGLGVNSIKSTLAEDIFSPSAYVVLLNGLFLGIHLYPKKFARNLRKLRREGRLGEFVSVFVDDVKKYVLIASDEGRVCRPLIIVEKGKSLLTAQDIRQLGKTKVFKNLLEEGKIEYIDVNESNNTMIALRESEIRENTTHLEIDPLTILGVVAGLIPYPHHNQSPRNTYQCAMGKQAIGTIGMNQYNRIDTLLYLMVYPQRPLVTTRTLDLVNFDNVPGGQNAVVAVMSYSGYDIEDATIMNKASLDRGYGRCIVLKKFATVLQTYSNQTKDRVSPYKPPEQVGPDGQIKKRPIPKNLNI